jgi:hypothetical protein
MLDHQMYMHIDTHGSPLNGQIYNALGVFHKGYATAKDEKGWYHIGRDGQSIYEHRFRYLEPFYNGQAFAESLEGKPCIVDDEAGRIWFM